MLIQNIINNAVKAGKLFVPERVVEWEGEPRAFFMCRPLFEALQEGRNSPIAKERQSWAELEAAMRHFIEGGPITDDRIKQLAPQKLEHWEMRILKPRPALRVFGRFADADVFIGTHVKLRKDLGDKWSQQFEHEKLVCEDHWRDAGLPVPYTAPPEFPYGSYITSNAQKKIRV
jgi:hypothetical protein